MDRRGLCLHMEPGRRREACFKGTRFGADGRRGARECLRGSRGGGRRACAWSGTFWQDRCWRWFRGGRGGSGETDSRSYTSCCLNYNVSPILT